MSGCLKIIILVFVVFTACKSDNKITLSYLALGDSYTIGESIDASFRWPVQLAKELNEEGYDIAAPKLVARTGWTTDELLTGIDTATLTPPYDLVSVLIGVNNQYRGRDTANYRQELVTVLEKAIELAGGAKDRVFVVSIPDWGVMPFAEDNAGNPEVIASEIDQFNQIKQEVSARKGLRFINITDISRDAGSRQEFIAEDGLHPSAKMYSAWVKKMKPELRSILSELKP